MSYHRTTTSFTHLRRKKWEKEERKRELRTAHLNSPSHNSSGFSLNPPRKRFSAKDLRGLSLADVVASASS